MLARVGMASFALIFNQISFLFLSVKPSLKFMLSVKWSSPGPCFLGGKMRAQRGNMGVRGLVPGKFLGATPFRRSENEGNALVSYILHHKHDYIEHKRQDILLIKNLCSLWQATLKNIKINIEHRDINNICYKLVAICVCKEVAGLIRRRINDPNRRNNFLSM